MEEQQSMVSLAKDIAYTMHKNQVDKAGKPYVEHLEFVANHVSNNDEKCVAYLHDILEDTDFSKDRLKEVFGERIFDAVVHMTHRDGEEYFDYIERVSLNPLSTAVKIADLTHNMMLDRLPSVTPKDLKRLEKYKKAYSILCLESKHNSTQ